MSSLSRALGANVVVAVVVLATFDALSFPIYSGLLFVVIGCLGALYRISTEPRTADSSWGWPGFELNQPLGGNMARPTIDVLMITYQSPQRTRISLGRLLEIADESTRIWLWHNGNHEPTLDVVRSFTGHPRIAHFHHSPENVRLRPPTNWLFENATGDYVSKIDDDAVLPHEWPSQLVAAHQDEPRFGVLGSWRFMDEDFDEALASAKIQQFAGGHRVLRNLWVEGSSFVMKRKCIDDLGPLADGQSFTWYCRELGRRGWVNGYYLPLCAVRQPRRSPLPGIAYQVRRIWQRASHCRRR